MGSIRPFASMGVFDDAAARIMGEAFDAACKELPYIGSPELVREIMARKIISAAKAGERNVLRLRDAALSALKSIRH